MAANTMDKVTSAEEKASNWAKIVAKRKFQEARQEEYDAEKERIWKKHEKDFHDPPVTQFNGEPFGGPVNEIIDTFLKDSAVSMGLFNVMVFACSGTAVQYCHDYIRQHHTVFVTSNCLAEQFESNKTKDDNLKIRVRLPDNTTISGFLGLYDDNIAIVTAFTTAFTTAHVYPVGTGEIVDLHEDTDRLNLFALGRNYGGPLMGTTCSNIDFSKDPAVSCGCAITQAGLGGPVILLDQDGNGHFAGVMVQVPTGEAPAKFLPTKLLDERLQLFGQVVTETSHFRGYYLPEGLRTVIPAGFLLRSLILKHLGYPLPPPLVVELCGKLVGTFEEMFGQLYACEGFPYELYDYGPEKPIWERLGKDVVQNLSRSLVSVSSFMGDVRCFSCTGLVITSQDRKVVLTSASLFRTGDADGKIDPTLRIEVFLSRQQCVGGQLDMYHQDYNIAIVSLMDDLTAVCTHDIFIDTKASESKVVVAIGRPTKEHEGLLMASMGNLNCGRKKVKGSQFDCKVLKTSTCKITKAGIGGPLIRIEDGCFVGMNFYDGSGPTPYLPRSNIVKVLKRGFDLLSRGALARPIILDMDTKGKGAKKNRWPVPKPYWYLAGNCDPLGRLGQKVPM